MANMIRILFDVDTKSHIIMAPDDVKVGDKIVVKMPNGNDIAIIVGFCVDLQKQQPETDCEFLRVATPQDLALNQQKIDNNTNTKQKVQNIITKYDIQLKLIKVHESFDNSKMLIVYTAPARIDFRQLVKELAGVFRTHIEMRQITDRESASMLGNIAECGQELCCRKFLYDPQVVTIKMAKTQDMALNPTKINGVCGKLRCCLAFENDQYKQVLERMPEMGAHVKTPNGQGEVVYRDLLREVVQVKFSEDDIQSFELDKITNCA